MNAIQVNAQTLQSPQNLQMLQNLKNATGNANIAGQAQNGDFFAAFLQSLAQASGTTPSLTADAILGDTGTVEQNGNGVKNGETAETAENTAAMEMASGLLSGNYGFDWLLPSTTASTDYSGESEVSPLNLQAENPALANLQGLIGGGQNTDIMQILGQTSQPQTANGDTATSSKFLEQMALLQQTANGQEQQVQQAQQNAVTQTAQTVKTNQAQETTAQTAQMAQMPQTAQTAQNTQTAQASAQSVWKPTQTPKDEFQLHKGIIENPVKSDKSGSYSVSSDRTIEITPLTQNNGEASAQSSSEQLFNGNMNFQTAVAQVQKALKGKDNKAFSDESALQTQQTTQTAPNIDTTGIEKAEALKTTPNELDTNDLFEKVKTGMQNGTLSETKELSVKLKPEGLGEVTIKLIKEQNQITVQIVTASEQTAKLLNDQLPNLRQTMQSLQTEIRDVQISQQQLQQQNFNQQGNGQMNQQGNEQHNTQNGFYGNSADNSGILANEIPQKQELAESGMDIYA